MSTEPIPEAKSAAELIVNWHNRAGDHEELDLLPIIHAALIDYHQRRLAECGGDAQEAATEIENAFDNALEAECKCATSEHGCPFCSRWEKARGLTLELLRLHTAKAVEKAAAELRGYLERAGWGPCNISACNCNGWHQVRSSRA